MFLAELVEAGCDEVPEVADRGLGDVERAALVDEREVFLGVLPDVVEESRESFLRVLLVEGVEDPSLPEASRSIFIDGVEETLVIFGFVTEDILVTFIVPGADFCVVEAGFVVDGVVALVGCSAASTQLVPKSALTSATSLRNRFMVSSFV